nr:MAG: hypothetical protein [Chemarfal virus 194]
MVVSEVNTGFLQSPNTSFSPTVLREWDTLWDNWNEELRQGSYTGSSWSTSRRELNFEESRTPSGTRVTQNLQEAPRRRSTVRRTTRRLSPVRALNLESYQSIEQALRTGMEYENLQWMETSMEYLPMCTFDATQQFEESEQIMRSRRPSCGR